MVAGLLAAAIFLVDPGVEQPVGGLRRQQRMIDADAIVLLPRTGLVVPERVDAAGGMEGAQRVGEAEVENRAVLRPGLGLEQRIAGPVRRVPRIARRRDDVEVAGEDRRRALDAQRARGRDTDGIAGFAVAGLERSWDLFGLG